MVNFMEIPIFCYHGVGLEVLRLFISVPKFLREKLGNYLVNTFGRAKVGRPMSVKDGLRVIFDQGNRGKTAEVSDDPYWGRSATKAGLTLVTR